MAAPSMVFAATYAALRFRVDLDVIEELAEQMRTIDGCSSVLDQCDEMAESITAFTPLTIWSNCSTSARLDLMKDA